MHAPQVVCTSKFYIICFGRKTVVETIHWSNRWENGGSKLYIGQVVGKNMGVDPIHPRRGILIKTQAKIIDNSHLQFSSNSHAIIDEIFRNAPAILTYNSHPILTRQFSSNSHLQFSSNSHLTILIQFSPDNSHPILI